MKLSLGPRFWTGASMHLRQIGQLFIVPAVLIPIWLLAVAGFSTIGLLPAGTLLAGILSIVFIRSRIRARSDNTLLADIGSKLITYCYVMIGVSAFFLTVQAGIYLFLTQFSPTLETIVAWYNALRASALVQTIEALTLKARVLIILAIACSLIFFPLLSPRAVRLSKLTSRAVDIVGAFTIAFLLFAFYGASSSGLNAVRIELRSTEAALNTSYRHAVDETSHRLVKAVLDQSLDQDPHPLKPPGTPFQNGGPSNPGDGSAGPGPRSPSPNPGIWDAELGNRIKRSDDRKTETAIEKLKSSPRPVRAILTSQPVAPPAATSRAKLESYQQAIADGSATARDGGLLSEVQQRTRTLAAREMIGVALDAADFPEIVAPAVSDLVKETVSGAVIRDVLKALSDDVFADAVRSVAGELVNEFLNGALDATALKSEIRKRASTLLNSNVGQLFNAAMAKDSRIQRSHIGPSSKLSRHGQRSRHRRSRARHDRGSSGANRSAHRCSAESRQVRRAFQDIQSGDSRNRQSPCRGRSARKRSSQCFGPDTCCWGRYRCDDKVPRDASSPGPPVRLHGRRHWRVHSLRQRRSGLELCLNQGAVRGCPQGNVASPARRRHNGQGRSRWMRCRRTPNQTIIGSHCTLPWNTKTPRILSHALAQLRKRQAVEVDNVLQILPPLGVKFRKHG